MNNIPEAFTNIGPIFWKTFTFWGLVIVFFIFFISATVIFFTKDESFSLLIFLYCFAIILGCLSLFFWPVDHYQVTGTVTEINTEDSYFKLDNVNQRLFMEDNKNIFWLGLKKGDELTFKCSEGSISSHFYCSPEEQSGW